MISTDKPEFETQLTMLCQGYGFWLGDRLEAYWKGLQKMTLVQFARCVEYALSEEGPEKIPNTHGVWKIHRELRQWPTAPTPEPPPPEVGKWLGYVNGLFLKYLLHRRVTLGETADINLAARRQRCRDIAAWFEGLEAERDPEATMADLERKFKAAMHAIPDAIAAEVAA